MSGGVSQINYWRSNDKTPTETQNAKNGEGGPGGAYLSYNVYAGLALLGGFFALDHLYLRSPLTFLAKIVINIIFFGVWWLYDASQAFFNKDVVKAFGLPVPGMGPKGIGAGMLVNDISDKKHLNFLFYGVALLFGGLIGLDSFIVGDKTSGIIRILSLLSIIFSPLAIGWWLYNMFNFFFKTKDVTNQYWEYFGAPVPAEYKISFGDKLAKQFPFLGAILGPIKIVKNVSEALATNPEGAISEIVKGPLARAIALAKPAINEVVAPVIQPAANAIRVASKAVSNVAGTAREALLVGREGIETGAKVAEDAITAAKNTATGLTAVAGLAANASSMTTGFTENVAKKALEELQSGGGNDSNILPYMLIGTIGIIAVSGLILTYQRTIKNVKRDNDDPPPRPGVL
jgi:hypothetical protein